MPKRIKKAATLDDVDSRVEGLARMTERGFAGVGSQIRESEQRVIQAIEGLELKISAYAGHWSQDFERLEKRVRALEAKTGIR